MIDANPFVLFLLAVSVVMNIVLIKRIITAESKRDHAVETLQDLIKGVDFAWEEHNERT